MGDELKARSTVVNADVASYKLMLATILDKRPSGTRQRLATALAKNRSFISQITNPNYSVPVPANHLDVIFEICHFSTLERKEFLLAYGQAHPARGAAVDDAPRLKSHTIFLPDMGDEQRNQHLLTLVSDFVRQISRLSVVKPPKKGSRR